MQLLVSTVLFLKKDLNLFVSIVPFFKKNLNLFISEILFFLKMVKICQSVEFLYLKKKLYLARQYSFFSLKKSKFARQQSSFSQTKESEFGSQQSRDPLLFFLNILVDSLFYFLPQIACQQSPLFSIPLFQVLISEVSFFHFFSLLVSRVLWSFCQILQ